MPWDPTLYRRFEAERSAPFEDLLALVAPRRRMRVVDLGCGTGQLTDRLQAALPESRVEGLDSSPEMLAQAMPRARPGLRFRAGRIEATAGKYDLVFSHAALQWVEDHESAFPRWLALLKPRGQLAVQMPANHDQPSHVLAREVAAEPRFAAALGGWTRASPLLAPTRYAELLFRAGMRDILVFTKVYPHVLAGPDALVEWVRGTLLVPYLDRLGPELSPAFLRRYRTRVARHYRERPLFFGFPRLFLSARAPS